MKKVICSITKLGKIENTKVQRRLQKVRFN